MNVWIALLRGINVGGNRRLSMADLRSYLAAEHQWTSIRTYIQSGNIVFAAGPSQDRATLERELKDSLTKWFQLEVPVLVLSGPTLQAIMEENPYGDLSKYEPNKVHFFFLASRPSIEDATAALDHLASKSEKFELQDDVLYLSTPEGFATSKIAKRAEHILGVPVTARNLRTVIKLLDMVKDGGKAAP